MTKVQIKSYKLVPFLSFLFTSFLYCSSEYTKNAICFPKKANGVLFNIMGLLPPHTAVIIGTTYLAKQ